MKKLSRFADWWFFKISYLFIPFYFFLLEFEGGLPLAFLKFFSLLGYFIFTATFGHMVNDLGDLESDLKACKNNASSKLGKAKTSAILGALLVASLGLLYIAGASTVVYALASVEVVLFFLYFLRPFRLKESYLGLAVDSAYAHVLPFSIAAMIMAGSYAEPLSSHVIMFIVAIAWQFFGGLRGIIEHELYDLQNDLSSGNRTAVVRMGADRARALMHRWVVPIELVLLVMLFCLLSFQLWLSVLGFTVYAIWFIWKNRIQGHDLGAKVAANICRDGSLDLFYRSVLPLLVIADVVIVNPTYWPFLPLHLILFNLRGIRKMPRSLIDRKITNTDKGVTVDLEGCYLTSRLTNRTDVNIEVATFIDGEKITVNLQYAPNRYVNYYSSKYEIQEKLVCFTLHADITRREGGERAEFLIQAKLLPSDVSVTLHKEQIDLAYQ